MICPQLAVETGIGWNVPDQWDPQPNYIPALQSFSIQTVDPKGISIAPLVWSMSKVSPMSEMDPWETLKHTSCNDTVSMSCISSNNQSWKVSQNQPVASPDVLGPSSPVLSAGVPAEFKSYPSMGHTYCPEASFPCLQGRSAKIRPGNSGNHEADSRSQLMFWDILSWLGPSTRYPPIFLQLVCSQGVWTSFESAEKKVGTWIGWEIEWPQPSKK